MRRETAVATSPACTRGFSALNVNPVSLGLTVPRVLVADADPAQGTPTSPEGHTRRVRCGIKVAQHDRRAVPGIPLHRHRGTASLLLTFEFEREWPAWFVMSHHQPPGWRVDVDDQRGAPRQVLAVFGGALVDLR